MVISRSKEGVASQFVGTSKYKEGNMFSKNKFKQIKFKLFFRPGRIKYQLERFSRLHGSPEQVVFHLKTEFVSVRFGRHFQEVAVLLYIL